MDSLVFSGFVRLDSIPHARFFNRKTWEPVTLSRWECTARDRNLEDQGHDHEETARALAAWPAGDA